MRGAPLHTRLKLVGLFCCLASSGPSLAGEGGAQPPAFERLLGAYPDHLDRIEDGTLIWRDGTRMTVDDGRGEKPFEEWLERPDIEDMGRIRYPAGAPPAAPDKNADPGRARNSEFFEKMYGNCRKGEVTNKLADIAWLPARSRRIVKVTTVNRVHERLAAVSRELELLPARFDTYLVPAAGAYNCRTIEGTGRPSAHGYGIAVDIAVRHSDYWRWAKPATGDTVAYRNAIPMEIVRIFEDHGFIWGGRWYHYDTMHFEYRPELLPEAK